ncbi:OLC1v1011981C1 [Oldenlandia corymbosa var. corymbosa]|uniref:OLC1v1011981C1 n=1 Tax=Oldenlandia corymbosa var. corymbosa TaxID=529605 RepID=A0AAV1DVI3_OLDCO|nr:OLC1v1011981C1 [Oldenlandia corymbosa var. corymbosa]
MDKKVEREGAEVRRSSSMQNLQWGITLPTTEKEFLQQEKHSSNLPSPKRKNEMKRKAAQQESWEKMAYPTKENGLGTRSLSDVLDAFFMQNVVEALVKNGNHVESIRHNFFECSYAKHWRHFGAIMVFANNEILDFDDLSSTWWTRRQSSKLTWKLQILLPSLICWQLWKCRNKAIFESTIISPHIAVRLIVQDLHIMAKAVPFKASSAKDSSFVTA